MFNARADLTTKDVDIMVKKIDNIYPKGSEVVMTLADKLREEGREALIKTAIKLLTKKFGSLPEEIRVRISKLDLVTLEVIIDGIFEYESLEDVKKYIN
ncbi:conserved protein of unknown function [Tepidanaerobacter acetatoxydans Re1]|uniref:DUF4351 domain-containing protein n=2 Tax=Tepidanaerobacter acetatoxydans TaxID=499229 RepID=U4QDA4_TEPAE|nr:conserved protein of unknown function [Tepidanaerobacter acetatoxydans Re1]